MGVLEILSKYMDSADRYTKGHCVRVADLVKAFARVRRQESTNTKKGV